MISESVANRLLDLLNAATQSVTVLGPLSFSYAFPFQKIQKVQKDSMRRPYSLVGSLGSRRPSLGVCHAFASSSRLEASWHLHRLFAPRQLVELFVVAFPGARSRDRAVASAVWSTGRRRGLGWARRDLGSVRVGQRGQLACWESPLLASGHLGEGWEAFWSSVCPGKGSLIAVSVHTLG